MNTFSEPIDPTTEPENILFKNEENRERQDIARSVLEGLPRPYRLLLLSLYYEGVSHEEVARRLGRVSRTKTVFRLEADALAELRYRFENGYVTEPLRRDLHMLMQGAKYKVQGRRPRVFVRSVNCVLTPEFRFNTGSKTTAYAEGALNVLRVLDLSLFHRDAAPVIHAEPMLMREFCESRLLRPGKGLSPFEKSLAERLNK